MEAFAVAGFGALVSVTMAKLLTVKGKKVECNAMLIKDKLEMITGALEDYAYGGRKLSRKQARWIAQQRRFAYEIEDCIDCFQAMKKPEASDKKAFAQQIAFFKERAEGMDTSILALDAQQRLLGRTQGSVDESQDQGNNERELYLCLFPGKRPVRTKPLVRRWMAEGLVLREQPVVENLDKFIDFSILDSISIKRSNNGKVREFQPNDVRLKGISQQSLSVNFILVSDGIDRIESALPEAQDQVARRLTVHPPANGVPILLPQDLSRLRTLAVFPDAGATSVASYEAVLDFAKYGVLRVLDLKECAYLTKKHLDDIMRRNRQVLLKYLSMNLDSIRGIEREIGYLKQLETLELGGIETVEVFKDVLLLPKLKHLLGKFQLSTTPIDKLWMSDLQSFLSKDSVLETLDGFVTSMSDGFQDLMRFMKSLRKVKIWFKSDTSEEKLLVLSSAIAQFLGEAAEQSILKWSLSIDFTDGSGEFAKQIKAVTGNLDSLKLRGKLLGELPPFVLNLSGIVELCLWSTDMSWKDIRAGLPLVSGLKFLKLIEDNLECFDILAETDEQFRSVERICVVSKKKLKVAITATPLPNIVSLYIICQELHDSTGTDGINITGMGDLEEVALHLHVDQGIRTRLENAAVGHVNEKKLKILSLDYPQ